LHGPQTIQADRDVFRKQLKTGKSFSAKITNHRKNGEAYVCEVKIVPLYNTAKELTHFLALEKEVA
jgi:hypothetical protein